MPSEHGDDAGAARARAMLATLRRRIGWLGLGAILGLGAGLALHAQLPASYVARSSLLVESGWSPSRYLESPVSGSLRERLATLEHQLTSDEAIARLIGELEELEGAGSGDGQGRALGVEELRKRLAFEVVDAESSRSAVFAISYEGSTPSTSKQVVQTLIDQLIEGRQEERRVQAASMAGLLEDRARELRESLRERETKAARNGWELTPRSDRAEAAVDSSMGALQKLRAQLAKARSLYTDAHPNVVQLRDQLARQERMMRKPPESTDWVDQNRDPRYRDLLRDYQTEFDLYRSIVTRQLEATMAQNLEWDVAAPEVVILRDAELRRFPAERDLPLFAGGGVFSGLALSACLFALPALIRRPVFRGIDDLSEHSGLPVVAAVPKLARCSRTSGSLQAVDPRLVVALEPELAATEQYRRFLPYLDASGPNPVVLVTSAERGEGKSTAVANLAAMTALDGDRRVLLIDGDLRRPTMHRKLGIRRSPGLTELVEDELPLEECLVRTAIPNLVVLPAGRPTRNPLRLLRSERLHDLVANDRYRLRVDATFLDAPPLLPVVDARVLERVATSLLFVVRADRTPQQSVFRSLRDVRVPVGLLLNDISVYSYRDYYRRSPYRSPYPPERHRA